MSVEAMSSTSQTRNPCEHAVAFAADLVKVYDGDQVDFACVSIGGVLVRSESGKHANVLAEELRRTIARKVDGLFV